MNTKNKKNNKDGFQWNGLEVKQSDWLVRRAYLVVYVKFCNYEFGQCCLSGLLGEECRGGDVSLLCIQ